MNVMVAAFVVSFYSSGVFAWGIPVSERYGVAGAFQK